LVGWSSCDVWMDCYFNHMQKFCSRKFMAPLLTLIAVVSSFDVYFSSFPWLLILVTLQIFKGWVLLSIALKLNNQIHVAWNSTLMFLFVKHWFMAWFTHLTIMILLGSMWLLLNKVASLNFLNVVLNGWKQNTYDGCKTCDVWDGKVIMSNPNSCACSIASTVTWLGCPSRINKY
jgi:hypothetical protein